MPPGSKANESVSLIRVKTRGRIESGKGDANRGGETSKPGRDQLPLQAILISAGKESTGRESEEGDPRHRTAEGTGKTALSPIEGRGGERSQLWAEHSLENEGDGLEGPKNRQREESPESAWCKKGQGVERLALKKETGRDKQGHGHSLASLCQRPGED